MIGVKTTLYLVEAFNFQCFYPHMTINNKYDFGHQKVMFNYYDVSVVFDLA